MQLSLVDALPELYKSVFLDVFARMSIDPRTKRPTLKTLEGQRVPADFKIRCDRGAITRFPEGTIYKLDIKLVETSGKRSYFSAIHYKDIPRALEFFEHNLLLQRGALVRKKVKSRPLSVAVSS